MPVPVVGSQTRTVPSSAPVARRVPSGDQATALIFWAWPASSAVMVPVAAFHTRTLT